MKSTVLSRLHRLEARASDVPAEPLVIVRTIVESDGRTVEPAGFVDALGHSWERRTGETADAFTARVVEEARTFAAPDAVRLLPAETPR